MEAVKNVSLYRSTKPIHFWPHDETQVFSSGKLLQVSRSFLSCVVKESASDKERRNVFLNGHFEVIYSEQIIK